MSLTGQGGLPGRGDEGLAPRTVVLTSLARPPRLLGSYARMAAGALCADTTRDGDGDGGEALLERRLELRAVTADPRRLARFRAVCGLRAATSLPVTFPHVMAHPLRLALLADRSFPLPPARLVVIENSIHQHRPVPIRQALSIVLSTGETEPHPRGRTVEVFTEARADGELLWESSSTMLHRSRPRPAGSRPAQAQRSSVPGGGREVNGGHQLWAVDRRVTRRYAAASGDRNPVYTHRIAALAARLPGAVAHGMWVKARALSAVQDELPGTVGVQAVFLRPVVLPGFVELRTRRAEGETELVVRDADTHLTHMRARAYLLPTAPQTTGARAVRSASG